MINKSSLFFVILLVSKFATAQTGSVVKFPEVSQAIQVSQDGKQHFFASYYGINSFSKNQRYITVLQTDVRVKLPDAKDTAILGLIDLHTNKFMPVAKTTAWNFQQGCMAHWLATSPDSVIIYNDYRSGKIRFGYSECVYPGRNETDTLSRCCCFAKW